MDPNINQLSECGTSVEDLLTSDGLARVRSVGGYFVVRAWLYKANFLRNLPKKLH